MARTIIHEIDPAAAIESGPARRILIAVHGHEPDGWTRALRTAVPPTGPVRVLLVENGAPPAFTSLLPLARRRYGAARESWERERAERRRAVLEAVVPGLPGSVDAVRIPACADPGLAIAAHARDWRADIVVVGRDHRSRLERALVGAIHERVIARAPCAVLVLQGDARPAAFRGIPGLRRARRALARGGA